MFIRSFVVFCLMICAFFGYYGKSGIQVQEASAAALNPAEVVAVWDMFCGDFNFDECPTNVLTEACDTTLGGMYSGSNFNEDIDSLFEVISIEVNSYVPTGPPIVDDLISAVVDDEAWFE